MSRSRAIDDDEGLCADGGGVDGVVGRRWGVTARARMGGV